MGTEAIENRFIVVVPLYRIASGSRFILAFLLSLSLPSAAKARDCTESVRAESEPETFLRWSIATFKKKGMSVAILNENR